MNILLFNKAAVLLVTYLTYLIFGAKVRPLWPFVIVNDFIVYTDQDLNIDTDSFIMQYFLY